MTLELGSTRGRARPASRAPRRVVMSADAVGGVWRYAIDLAGSLQQRGVAVALAGFGPPPSRAQRAEADAARLQLTWTDQPLDWMPGGLAASASVRREIARAADAFKADIAHVNSLAYAGREFSQPVLAVAHSCVPTWWRAVRGCEAPSPWREHLHANAKGLRAATGIIVPSHAHGASLRAAYGEDFDVRVVYNGSTPTPAFRRRREPLVFAAGRWWDEAKNARALDAAARLTKWPILMAGSLHDPGGPRATIAHARALGPLDARTTCEWMRRASVFVAPSLYEPFGLAILEAARASTPLVLADIPTFRELWDGAALFAPPHEPAAFAAAIDRLMADADLRRSLARRARARAGRLTLDAQADAMLAAYASAVAGAETNAMRSAV